MKLKDKIAEVEAAMKAKGFETDRVNYDFALVVREVRGDHAFAVQTTMREEFWLRPTADIVGQIETEINAAFERLKAEELES